MEDDFDLLKGTSNVNEEEDKEETYETVTSKDIDFVLDTVSKLAPYDKTQLKQIFLGICSSQTQIKLHHNINSRVSGEGKSYLLKTISDLFPEEILLKYNGMSSKSLYHQNGPMVIKNNETGEYEDLGSIISRMTAQRDEVFELINDEKAKSPKERDKNLINKWKQQIAEIEEKVKDLQSEAIKIIDLDFKAFCFLDTPDEALFNNLMSLLSQDSREQRYMFTDKDSSGKRLQTRTVLLRGTPLVVTTQVVDDTRNHRFQEKARRFINVNPNPSEEKIGEAMRQISLRLGAIEEDFDQIVSNEDIKRAKEIVEILCKKLRKHTSICLKSNIRGTGVLIPYYSVFVDCLPKETWYMTVLTRLVNYVAMITKVNMDSRPKVIDERTGMIYPIALYSDLKEALQLMKTASLNVRPYLYDWYTNIFLPLYQQLPKEPNCKMNEYNGNIIAKENVVGLTTREISEKTGQSVDEIYETYLRPAIKTGLINSTKSVLNGKENLYYPVSASADESLPVSLPLTEDGSLIIPSYNEKNVLEDSFRTIVRQRHNNEGGIGKKIIDIDGTELSLQRLLEKYFFYSDTPFRCADVQRFFYNNSLCSNQEKDSLSQVTAVNNLRYSQQILVRQQQFYANKDQDNSRLVEPSTPIEVKENTNRLDLAKHSQIPMDLLMKVDKFFLFNHHEESHKLESSICRPLIRTNGPFYQCILDRFENVHLSELEAHCKLKDPEQHKSELLLRLMEESEKNRDQQQ